MHVKIGELGINYINRSLASAVFALCISLSSSKRCKTLLGFQLPLRAHVSN